jgi:hypothetical protein
MSQNDLMHKLLDSKIELPIGLLKKKHIFIATPCYGGQVTEPYMRSILRLGMLCNKYEIPFTMSTLANESLVTRARNTLTAFFMASEATHLFFIDADIEFSAEDVFRMVAYDKPVIAGAYPKKSIDWNGVRKAAISNQETLTEFASNYAINFDFVKDSHGNRTNNIQIENNLIKLHDAGTGFMCIQRETIQKLFDAHPELKYTNDINIDPKFEPYLYALFDTWIEPASNRYLSEDYTFCRRWQAQSGTVYLDPRVNLNHVGHYTFTGNIRRLFSQ